MAMAQARQSRCACTLPFSLHLTVMILGIVGFILAVAATVLVFVTDDWYRSNGSDANEKGSVIWLLLSTTLIFVSGLQGLLVHDGSGWFVCHVILAVIDLINLGVLIFSVVFIGNVFWIIYMVAVFVFELWVTILRTCCTTREVAIVATELPVASPGAHAVQEHVIGVPYPGTYKVDPRQEAVGVAHPGQGRTDDQVEVTR